MALAPVMQTFDIAVDDTFPGNLSFTPYSEATCVFWLNTASYSTQGASPVFSVSGLVPSFSAGNAGFTLEAGETVYLLYFTDV